jgi:hypothetical protein
MPEPRTIWKAVTLLGFATVVIGFVDLAGFDGSYRVLFPAIGIGLLILAAGLVGWATRLGCAARARLAGLAILPPALVVVIGIFSTPNIHGLFPYLVIACIPLLLAGITLAIMALASHRP